MKHAENKLTQVVIRGYKSISFEKPVTLDIKDITVLLGANGAGKSNIISFFKMLGYMMSGTFQRFIAQSGTNQQFLYYGPKRTPSINAEIRFDSDKVYDTYRFSLLMTSRKKNAYGGMISYSQAKGDLTKWMKEVYQEKNVEHYFTTMFDFYALPNDFPGFCDTKNISDAYSKVNKADYLRHRRKKILQI